MITNPLTGNINSMTPTGFVAGLLSFLVNGLFILAIIYFFFSLVMGGISWIGAGGDKNALSEARARVSNAIVGIVVVLSTYIIVNLLASVFGIELINIDLSILQI